MSGGCLDEHLATVLDKTEAIVTLMDRLGYDTFWAAEHRFQREGYECIPNLLLLFVHLAHLTKRIKFGCGFNVAPMWHPLRLAEDFAVADRLTGGRIILGGPWLPLPGVRGARRPARRSTTRPTASCSKTRLTSSSRRSTVAPSHTIASTTPFRPYPLPGL